MSPVFQSKQMQKHLLLCVKVGNLKLEYPDAGYYNNAHSCPLAAWSTAMSNGAVRATAELLQGLRLLLLRFVHSDKTREYPPVLPKQDTMSESSGL